MLGGRAPGVSHARQLRRLYLAAIRKGGRGAGVVICRPNVPVGVARQRHNEERTAVWIMVVASSMSARRATFRLSVARMATH